MSSGSACLHIWPAMLDVHRPKRSRSFQEKATEMKKDFIIGTAIGLALIIFPIVLDDAKPCPQTIGDMHMAGCK